MMEWRISSELVEYEAAVAEMEARVRAIRAGTAAELVWLLEHPPLYTAGTSAKAGDLLAAEFPVHATGRGGQYTYHGPGQRVAYVLLDLKRLFAPEPPDLRRYIQWLEQWIISTLAEFGVESFTREGRVGVWVNPSSEAKIAALGVRVHQWVSYHGIAINVHPDLSHYAGIVPCGIREYGVTSLKELGIAATIAKVDAVLKQQFNAVFDTAERYLSNSISS
jgi:lipoyl(octanoyl) transferase